MRIPNIMRRNKDFSCELTPTGGVTIILQGRGSVVVNWGDGSSNTYNLTTTGDTNATHTYSDNTTRRLKIFNSNVITKFVIDNQNYSWKFNLAQIPKNIIHLHLHGLGSSVTGSINNLPTGLTYLRLSWLGTTFTGSIDNLPSGLTFLYFRALGTNLTGSIDNLPSNLTYLHLSILGTNLTGSIRTLANINNYLYILECGNSINIKNTPMPAWANVNIALTPQSGYGYTTTQVDNFLIGYSATAGTGSATIDLRGANQPRSAASDSAVAILVSKNKTILTNP